MSDTVLKSNHIVVKDEGKRVIDSNHFISERIKMLTEILEQQSMESSAEDFADGFVEGLNAEEVEQLLRDPSDDNEGEIIREIPKVDTQAIIDEANAQAEAIIAEANSKAEQILDAAQNEGELIKTNAEKAGHDAGYNAGYEAGLKKAYEIEAELNEKARLMDEDYERKIDELEPAFVETLTDIYSHVLGVDLSGNTAVVLYLLRDAIRNIDGSRNFFVHVSKSDFDRVNDAKNELVVGLGSNVTVEVIEDMTLNASECFIEAESGIFDCSLGIELELLKKELILLSYQKEN